MAEHVEKKQWIQKLSHDKSVQSRTFSQGQSVLIRVYGQKRKWTCGTILKPTGPVSYIMKLPNRSPSGLLDGKLHGLSGAAGGFD